MSDDFLLWDTTHQSPRRDEFQVEPFRPAAGFGNGHAQTLLATQLRPRGIIFQRVRLNTADGDFLDLDLPTVAGMPLPADAPVVLLLHGLEGDARRAYALEMYRQLAAHGVRSVGMNFRSCSGELNRTARAYHAGATDDVAVVHQWLDGRFPGVAKGMVGVSLGANMLLKYLGERGMELAIRLRAAAVLSPPFDLGIGGERMQEGINRQYAASFISSIQEKIRAKASLVSPYIHLQKALEATTLRELDDAYTAPLHGFSNAEDYYARCSSRRFLAGIQVPTLILRALDDPLLSPKDIPHELLNYNRALQAVITEHGGHVGWVEGNPLAFKLWAERQAAAFLARYLL
ncbi:MAG: alpha/beta fold hydrolase [Anaerolineae bacterium]